MKWDLGSRDLAGSFRRIQKEAFSLSWSQPQPEPQHLTTSTTCHPALAFAGPRHTWDRPPVSPESRSISLSGSPRSQEGHQPWPTPLARHGLSLLWCLALRCRSVSEHIFVSGYGCVWWWECLNERTHLASPVPAEVLLWHAVCWAIRVCSLVILGHKLMNHGLVTKERKKESKRLNDG